MLVGVVRLDSRLAPPELPCFDVDERVERYLPNIYIYIYIYIHIYICSELALVTPVLNPTSNHLPPFKSRTSGGWKVPHSKALALAAAAAACAAGRRRHSS